MTLHPARFAVLAFVLALASATLTCSQEPDTGSAAAPARLTRVTLNFNPSFTYAPLMIAKDEGFFRQEGIAIELVRLDSNSALAALAARKIDVLSTGLRASVFNMIQRGEPMQVVVGKGQAGSSCGAEAFVAPSAMAKRIAAAGGSPRGERVAMVRGGVGEYLVAQLLARHKLTVADVVAIPMPQGAPAWSREEMDAVRLVGEPNLSILLKEGTTSVVATSDEVAPGHQSACVVYGKRLLHDDPELGRRFMRAYIRGVRRFNEGKSDRNVEILSRHMKVPPDVIRQACWFTTKNDGRIDPRDVQPFLDWSLAMKYLDGPITATWWNPVFLDDAIRSLSGGAR